MNTKRDNFVDCLKAYACFLVVLGHVIVGIRNAGIEVTEFMKGFEAFIYSFHVPLFMFLSGFVYSLTGGWKRQGTRLKFVGHKLLNLGVPYLVFSIVYIVMNSFTLGTNHDSKIIDILYLWKKPVAQYWFLYALFVLFVIWSALSLFLEDKYIMIVFIVIGIVSGIVSINIPVLNFALPYSLYFGIGAGLKELYVNKFNSWTKVLMIIGHIILFTLIFIMFSISFTLRSALFSLIGIICSIAFISIVSKNVMIERALIFLNTYSFPIYILHTVFTATVRIVLHKQGIDNYYIHLIIGLIAGILFPTIIAMISRRIPIIDFCFYPSKNIKRMKESK